MTGLDLGMAQIAKNLLLGNSCQGCNHSKYFDHAMHNTDGSVDYMKVLKCASILRARHKENIRHIDSPKWETFKEYGLDTPEEKVCEFWE